MSALIFSRFVQYNPSVPANWPVVPTNAQQAFDALVPSAFEKVQFANTLVVSKNGNDGTANGTWEKPYLTIQAAINAVVAPTPPTRYSILVMPGTYVENITLKANVFLVGTVYNSTRLSGTVTLDASFTPAGDHRSGIANMFISGLVTANFLALSSNEGKLYFNTCRFGSGLTATSFSSINQLFIHDSEMFGTLTLNGMNTVLMDYIAFNSGAIIANYTAGGANALTTSGGSLFNVTINAVAGAFSCFFNHAVQDSATLNLNGTLGVINASSNSYPRRNLVTYLGGATIAQLFYTNDAAGIGYIPMTPLNWPVGTDTVQKALDYLITASGGGAWQSIVRVVTAPEAIAKQLTLVTPPANILYVGVALGGVVQSIGLDYIVFGSIVDWSGLGMDFIGVLPGDQIVVTYEV
jgi:hypothetical protein